MVETLGNDLFSGHIVFEDTKIYFDKRINTCTVMPTKSDSDVILCLQLLSKTLACTLHLSWHESIDHLCINPILMIGLIHKWSIDHKTLITL